MPKPQAIIRTSNEANFTVEESENSYVVRFRPVVFNVESQLLPSSRGNFVEIITRKAFDVAKKSDIRALFNHNPNKVMGRYREGSDNNTMTFEVDDFGVSVRCEISKKISWAADMVESIQRGDISGCSFRFWASMNDYKWTRDATRNNLLVGTLENAQEIDDYSIVTYPAYKQTENSVTVRSLEEFVNTEKPATIEPTPEQIRSQIQLLRLRLACV